jgi:hypothetical protein
VIRINPRQEGFSLNLFQKSFTMQVWVKRSPQSTDEVCVSSGRGKGKGGKGKELNFGFDKDNSLSFSFGKDADKPKPDRMQIKQGTGFKSKFGNDTDRWVHWTFAYNPRQQERAVFRDGSLVETGFAPLTLSVTGNIFVGAQHDMAFPFQGEMDEFRVFNTRLDDTLISYNYDKPPATGSRLVVALTFSELVTSSRFDMFKDVSGRENHGRFYKAVQPAEPTKGSFILQHCFFIVCTFFVCRSAFLLVVSLSWVFCLTVLNCVVLLFPTYTTAFFCSQNKLRQKQCSSALVTVSLSIHSTQTAMTELVEWR